MRRQRVASTVSGEERDAALTDRSDRDGRRRRAVRCVELDLLDVFEERREPGAAEDADVGGDGRHGYALLAGVLFVSDFVSDFVSVFVDVEPSFVESPELELDESEDDSDFSDFFFEDPEPVRLSVL
jgi:hypothetical protein